MSSIVLIAVFVTLLAYPTAQPGPDGQSRPEALTQLATKRIELRTGEVRFSRWNSASGRTNYYTARFTPTEDALFYHGDREGVVFRTEDGQPSNARGSDEHRTLVTVNQAWQHTAGSPGAQLMDLPSGGGRIWRMRSLGLSSKLSMVDVHETLFRDESAQPAPLDDSEARAREWNVSIFVLRPERDLSDWEIFTRCIIECYKLNEAQQRQAWSICGECSERARAYFASTIDKIDAWNHESDELRKNPKRDPQAVRRLERERQELWLPIDRILAYQLRPRLERLPTRAQRRTAERESPGDNPNACPTLNAVGHSATAQAARLRWCSFRRHVDSPGRSTTRTTRRTSPATGSDHPDRCRRRRRGRHPPTPPRSSFRSAPAGSRGRRGQSRRRR